MEVAVKYQYNSATAFSRAFEKFHGIKPSKVKEMQHNLKVFSKLYFEENKIDENSMEYSIIEKVISAQRTKLKLCSVFTEHSPFCTVRVAGFFCLLIT